MSLHLQIGVRERSITQPKPKLVDGRDILFVKPAIIDKDPLRKVQLWRINPVIRNIQHVSTILRPIRSPRKRGLASRVDVAVEDIDKSVSTFLAGETGPQDRGDVGVVVELVDESGAGGVQHHDSVGTV